MLANPSFRSNKPLTPTVTNSSTNVEVRRFAVELLPMSRDSAIKATIIASVAILGATLAYTQKLSFATSELAGPVGVVIALGPCAWYYQRRKATDFVMTLLALMHLMVFTSAFTVAMYGVAALNTPLADELLANADTALGLHVPQLRNWAIEHPGWQQLLMLAYHSVIPQTLVLVLILGFGSQRKALESFVLWYMVCLVITLLIFAAVPAECPFTYFELEATAHQVHYLEHLQGFRSGDRTAISLSDCEGLITFPSFHTSYALMLTFAFWRRWRLFIPFAIVNFLVIIATVTSGWHYCIDIPGGIAVFALTVYLTKRLQVWLYADTQPSPQPQAT